MPPEESRPRQYKPTRERRARLVGLIQDDDGPVDVHLLAAALGVSASTVRRDVRVLEEERLLTRTYGGVIDHGEERGWRQKSLEHRRQKRLIAKRAAREVQPGMTVLLDAGTTVAELARLLGERDDIHLVTNGLSTLLALADCSAEVTVLGGRLRRPSESIIGITTVHSLDRLSPDIAFIGAEALDPVDGINCPERDQAVTKEIMAERSRVYWVLADSSKLSRPANFPHWCRLGAGRGLIVDGGGPDEVLAPFEQAEWVVARARG